MTIDVVAPSAQARQLVPGGTYGNLQRTRGEATLAAATQNTVVALVRVPAHSVISRVFGTNAQLGVSTVLEIGWEAVGDATSNDPDAFADVADGNVAGIFDSGADVASVTGVAGGLVTTEDVYITVKQTAVATGAGLVTVTVDYEYVGI